ncbi:uncharacterized protein V1510DRAFT_421302 [Dipodascopsis tothii]|uniref:uncharacterized protein n=1 Tax=Dipodascopsis tothii TaxID=44089 RepID=UPI0034CF2BEA
MSLEAALEEERLEILKLLNIKNPEPTVVEPSAAESSHAASKSSRRFRAESPPARVTQKALAAKFHNLSPSAQQLLLSTTDDPSLLAPERRGHQRSTSVGSAPSESRAAGNRSMAAAEAAVAAAVAAGSGSMFTSSEAAAVAAAVSGAPGRRSASASGVRSASDGRRRSGSQPRPKMVLAQPEEPDFSTAYRRMSDAALLKSGGSLAGLATRSPRTRSSDRLPKDHDDDDAAVASSSDESDVESSESESDSGASDSDEHENGGKKPARAAAPRAPYRVKSLIEAPPPTTNEAFSTYKRHLVHPKTAFDLVEDTFTTPYTSDNEEKIDIRKAVNMPLTVSDMESDAARVLRTITRGNFDEVHADTSKKQRSYVVATDSSPEASYALEWTIGTVLRDGNIMYAVYAIEEPDDQSQPADEDARQRERIAAAQDITTTLVRLLKKTRLQVRCVIEVMHCKSARHLLCDVIDYLNPTMVVLGSRGRSALKGVLLGSFSNYLVTKSSVPVMVARRKLKKSRRVNHRFANNLREGVTSLSLAKVD